MADDDDQGTSSGSRPKLLLPKAPGPAQPLSHAASRHRKKLDAALSAGRYYDVALGRESSRAKRIQVIDLSLHPGLTAPQVAALPPDRQYKYQIEQAELELLHCYSDLHWLLFRTGTNDLTGGVRRGTGAT